MLRLVAATLSVLFVSWGQLALAIPVAGITTEGEVVHIGGATIQVRDSDGESEFVITEHTVFCRSGARVARSDFKSGDFANVVHFNSKVPRVADVVFAEETIFTIPSSVSSPDQLTLSLVFPKCTYSQPDPWIKKIQKLLAESGYDVGAVDGIFGPKSQAAYTQFQDKYQFLPTGVPNNAERSYKWMLDKDE